MCLAISAALLAENMPNKTAAMCSAFVRRLEAVAVLSCRLKLGDVLLKLDDAPIPENRYYPPQIQVHRGNSG